MVQLDIVLFPFMAHGHMIPTLDMAKLFLSRGLKPTIIATAPFSGPITKARESGLDIGLTIVKFPPKGSLLPDHIVTPDQLTTPDLHSKFFEAVALLQEPVEKLLHELNPNCLVSDMLLPWTVDSAAKLGIPRLVFHGTSYFSLCISKQMHLHKPFRNVESDSEPFLVPNLPDQLTFTRTQVSPYERATTKTELTEMMEQMWDSVGKSYGTVINSFLELESDYAEHYQKVLGRKAWHIGPLLLTNSRNESKLQGGGKESAIDECKCMAWLDSRKPNSVIYICHGTIATFSTSQLREMAIGIEASGQDFIWVVRKEKNQEDNNEEWLPEGFEQRTNGKGLIIRGWAPQRMILDHPAVGAFVTHCGWNSTLEGICAGVPMVTWPVFAEQFYNEKLVTDVLKIGVSIGNKNWQRTESEGVSSEAVAKAVDGIMVGETAMEMRNRAKYYQEMARKAVEEDGSSYNSLDDLIQELSVYQPPKKQDIN